MICFKTLHLFYSDLFLRNLIIGSFDLFTQAFPQTTHNKKSFGPQCRVKSRPLSSLLRPCFQQQSLPVANHTLICPGTNPTPSETNKQGTGGDLQAARAVSFCLLRCDTFSERPLLLHGLPLHFSATLWGAFFGHDSQKSSVLFLTALRGRFKAHCLAVELKGHSAERWPSLH